MFSTILLILAWVCFLLATLGVNPLTPRLQLLPLGLLFWVTAALVGPVSISIRG